MGTLFDTAWLPDGRLWDKKQGLLFARRFRHWYAKGAKIAMERIERTAALGVDGRLHPCACCLYPF